VARQIRKIIIKLPVHIASTDIPKFEPGQNFKMIMHLLTQKANTMKAIIRKTYLVFLTITKNQTI
jgi:hypothetical protein